MKPQNSKNTSVNKCLPALYKKLESLYMCGKLATEDIDTIIDYGCGRYPEFVEQWCADRDKILFQYDPLWEIDREFNPERKAPKNYMLCLSNVLNVCVDWKYTLRSAIEWKDRLRSAINYWWVPTESPHIIIIKVYEGDRSGIGKWSSKGYQQNLPLDEYYKECVMHFSDEYWWFTRKGLLIGERLR